MAEADSNPSQQEIKDKLDQSLHQILGTLAVMVSHPELNQIDNRLLCNALWGIEQDVKAVRAQVKQLTS